MSGVEGEEVVFDGRDVDQAGEQEVREFDKHSKVRHFGDDGGEGLGGLRAGLHLEVFQELQFLGFLFRFGSGPFRTGEVLGKLLER